MKEATATSPFLALDQAVNHRWGDRYLRWLSVVLLGYAILGRGFAYFGVPPFYIGEISLLLGLIALLYSGSLTHIFYFVPARLLLVLMIWGSACTLPYLFHYRLEALRDAALWGYGLFAFIVVGLLIQRPTRLKLLLLWYRRLAVAFLCTIWALFLVKRLGILSMPQLPGSPVALGVGKGGDMMVHLTGVTAFMLLGMARTRLIYYLLIGITFLIGATISRGGMLSFALPILVLFVLKPPQIKVARFFYGLCLLITILLLLDPATSIKKRSVSAEQLWTNIVSVVGEADTGNLDSTKEWRLEWWERIISYTFGGPYFWTGKGFGINLADDDGFQVQADGSLRSPHNAHMNMLARAGVPGLLLWLSLQLSWVWHLGQQWLQSRREEDRVWEGVFLFLIVYWTAFMVNASFDVFLEGPMGGIWFWTLFGVGLAALHIYKLRPEVLRT